MAEEKEKIDFEKEIKRLQQIVEKIEGETLPLEESIKLYEEGTKIIKKLESAIKDAESKMAQIIESDVNN